MNIYANTRQKAVTQFTVLYPIKLQYFENTQLQKELAQSKPLSDCLMIAKHNQLIVLIKFNFYIFLISAKENHL